MEKDGLGGEVLTEAAVNGNTVTATFGTSSGGQSQQGFPAKRMIFDDDDNLWPLEALYALLGKVSVVPSAKFRLYHATLGSIYHVPVLQAMEQAINNLTNTGLSWEDKATWPLTASMVYRPPIINGEPGETYYSTFPPHQGLRIAHDEILTQASNNPVTWAVNQYQAHHLICHLMQGLVNPGVRLLFHGRYSPGCGCMKQRQSGSPLIMGANPRLLTAKTMAGHSFLKEDLPFRA